VLEAKNRLLTMGTSYVFHEPGNLVRQYLQSLDNLRMRIQHEVWGKLREGVQYLDDLGLRMLHQVEIRRQSCRQDFKRLDTQLRSLNPSAVLQRGYSITRDEKGRIVHIAADLLVGQHLFTRVAKGIFESEVVSTDDTSIGKGDDT